MKIKNTLLLILMLVSFVGYSQETKQDSIYVKIQIMPEYTDGGMQGFRKFIVENYKAPKIDKPLKGRIWIQFVVEKDGSLSDIKSVRDLGYGTGEEAIRILKESPKWKPGTQDGKPLRVQYSLPIDINIEKSPKKK